MPLWLQQPWALLAIPLALALVWLTRHRLRRLGLWRRRLALGLRLTILLALAGALAQPLLRVPDDRLSVVFALDVSQSLDAATQSEIAGWVEQAMRARGSQDLVGAVAFGRDAHVVRPPTSGESPVLPAAVQVDGTNLARGLQLAGALAQGEGSRRIVLISDGWATEGDAEQTVGGLEDIQLLVVPVRNGLPRPEVVLQRIDVPSYVREGESFDAVISVGATETTAGTLRAFVDEEPVLEQHVQLVPGHNSFTLELQNVAGGFHRLHAVIEPEADATPTNNTAYAFVVVKDRPRLLVVEEREGDARAIASLAAASGMDVQVINPSALPPLPELERFDALVLSNVSATSFTLDQLNVLNAYVGSLGHGLVVLGGPTTFALGNYGGTPLEQALPLSANIPTKREGARIALLLVIDRSGSMDLKSDGVAKIEMAKEAAILATQSLRPGDIIGVLGFDMRPRWVVPLQQIAPESLPAIETQIARLEADGGTDIYAALERAYEALRGVRAEVKHIVLLSDGQGWEAKYEELASQMRAAGIGLSAIAVGNDADTQLLSRLARWGEGRYYFTERVLDIPQIVTQEAAIAKRTALVEGTIRPQLITSSPILRSIAPADLPPLGGYIATVPKDNAQVVLATDTGEPLLAQWYYGLGKTVAWTSDLSPHWASEWLNWAGNQRFWNQALRWVMPTPASRELHLSVALDGREARIIAESVRDGEFVNLAPTTARITLPDGRVAEVPLHQVAPGRYETSVVAEAPGVYQVDISQTENGQVVRQETTGFSIREDAEMGNFGANEPYLRRLASATGGWVIERPEEAFSRDRSLAGHRWEPLWWRLLLVAGLLWPVDIAVRRLPWPPTRALASLLVRRSG